jgi:hypothetical protein
MSALDKLIVNVKESLEREMGHLREAIRDGFQQMAARFDPQAARLDRRDGAEKIDPALEAAELNKRVADLGTRLPRSNSL